MHERFQNMRFQNICTHNVSNIRVKLNIIIQIYLKVYIHSPCEKAIVFLREETITYVDPGERIDDQHTEDRQ